jgi:hypothetical protein
MSLTLITLNNGDANTINLQRDEEWKELAKYKVAEQTRGEP